MITTTWQPKHDQLIVRPLTPTNMTASGLVIADPDGRERPQFGVVVSAGPGLRHELTGTLAAPTSAVGDLVAFGKYAGVEMTLEPEAPPVLIMRDLEAIVGKPAGAYALVEHEGGKFIHEVGYHCEHCPRETSTLIEEERARLREAERAREAAAEGPHEAMGHKVYGGRHVTDE